MAEITKIGINEDFCYELSKPVDFPDEIMKLVNSGKVSSDAIGIYCLCEEVRMLKLELKAIKNELATLKK